MINLKRAAAALAAAGALVLAGAGAASAHTVPSGRPNATPSCGSYCVNLFSEQAGPLYVLSTPGVFNAPVFTEHASNTAAAEDFHAYEAGTLGQFIHAGLIKRRSYSALNYPWSWPVFEAQWAPYGVDSGLCAAVKGTAHNGSLVVLRDCGAAARSLWVGDLINEVADSNSTLGFDVPLVNASDVSFSRQLVLTYNGVGAQLTVTEIQQDLGVTSDANEFGLTPVA